MKMSIQTIIDHMFMNVADNAETRALHEELLNNCLEHYNDLISRGMTDVEAMDAVVDSLKGMKEVIDEYPKKPGSEAARKEEAQRQAEVSEAQTEKTAPEASPAETPSEYTFSSWEIRRLRTDLKGSDLKIGRSADDRIHVRCEDMEQMICRQDGDTLSVKVTDRTRKSFEEAGKSLNDQDISVKGLLKFIGKAIEGVASNISVSKDVYVDLPETVLAEMNLNAKSGDIDVRAVLPERLNVHTMSGDVKVEAVGNRAADEVSISGMSGDIRFEGGADSVTISSMSGDVESRGVYRKAEMKSTSGDVTLKGEAEQIRVSSVSGDVTTETRNTDVQSITASSTSGDVEIRLAVGTNSVHAAMSSVSGSTSCHLPDGGIGAFLQIQAKSVSGDVMIR